MRALSRAALSKDNIALGAESGLTTSACASSSEELSSCREGQQGVPNILRHADREYSNCFGLSSTDFVFLKKDRKIEMRTKIRDAGGAG